MTAPLNSVVAYHSLTDLEKRQKDVLAVIEECPGVSAPEVFKIMRRRGFGVQKNSVSPRLTELVEIGAVRIIGTKINRTTGRKVAMYKVVEKEVANGTILNGVRP